MWNLTIELWFDWGVRPVPTPPSATGLEKVVTFLNAARWTCALFKYEGILFRSTTRQWFGLVLCEYLCHLLAMSHCCNHLAFCQAWSLNEYVMLCYVMLSPLHGIKHAREITLVTAAGRRPLRSADNRTCLVKSSHNQFSDRWFATAGPTLWNSLPEQLRQPDITFRQFKRSLRTFMFG